ncbi:unnamed protein product [Allacma fusca]|uniref:CRAL-TRIO domain-containing protein n=1 Tax=Allacma fusca TaxID=39272 RepID=A0A8J2JF07_9HEXA|nr:unnamed protein product [Allacma fusca]
MIKSLPLSNTIKHEKFAESEEFQFFLKPELRNTTTLSDSEYLEFLQELEVWEAPKYIQEGFAYKFTGYDLQNRPIWVSSARNCPIRKVIESHEEEILEKYVWQAARCIVKSIFEKSREENPSRLAVFVVNAEGLSLFQFMHARTLAVFFKYAKKYKDVVQTVMALGVIINANRVCLWILNLLRPILYGAFERIEVYGSDESLWGPRVREIFGSDFIPSFAGDYHCFPQVCNDLQKN